MLEDTNSLDGAHVSLFLLAYFVLIWYKEIKLLLLINPVSVSVTRMW